MPRHCGDCRADDDRRQVLPRDPSTAGTGGPPRSATRATWTSSASDRAVMFKHAKPRHARHRACSTITRGRRERLPRPLRRAGTIPMQAPARPRLPGDRTLRQRTRVARRADQHARQRWNLDEPAASRSWTAAESRGGLRAPWTCRALPCSSTGCMAHPGMPPRRRSRSADDLRASSSGCPFRVCRAAGRSPAPAGIAHGFEVRPDPAPSTTGNPMDYMGKFWSGLARARVVPQR